jgi:PAS domain S-box-containing protein
MESAIDLLLVGTSLARIERLTRSLENLPGYRLQVAATPAEARTRILNPPQDAFVILSLQADNQALALLEPLDGFPRVPLLVLLEREDTAAAVRAIKAGAIEVLVESPSTLEHLPEAIAAILTEWRQRRDQNLAHDNAARFGHILASALTEIYTFDAKTLLFLRVNHGARKNIGYSKQELLRMTPLDLKPLLSREQFDKLLRPLRTGEREAVRLETMHRRKDGSSYPVEVQLQLVQGKTPVFIAVCLDISDRKQALAQLQASELRFRSFFDSAAAGMVILSPYGEILEANPFFREFCGYRADELTGLNIEELTHPDDRETTTNYYAALRQGQNPIVNIEKRYLRKDGQFRWGHASIACVPGRGQNEGYCIGLVQDIGRNKEAEAKMQQAYDELDAFVHTVAHDLRSPLTPIIGIAEYLQNHASKMLDQPSLNFLAEIERTGYRMLALLEDLLDLARVGHVQPPAVPVATRRVVDEVLQGLAEPIARANARIRIGKLSPLCLPETLISQLFDNLICNALRYAGAAGQPIEIGEEHQEGQLVLFVRDHGPGIPDEEIGHVFEVFYQGKRGRQAGGTGIGLATVRKIARLYQGDAWVETTPGGGCTFRTKFPVSILSCSTGDNQAAKKQL